MALYFSLVNGQRLHLIGSNLIKVLTKSPKTHHLSSTWLAPACWGRDQALLCPGLACGLKFTFFTLLGLGLFLLNPDK